MAFVFFNLNLVNVLLCVLLLCVSLRKVSRINKRIMNREIIFRGKRLDNDEWMYGDLMRDDQGGCYIYPLDSLGLFVENKVDPDTVGQFTGMNDKHENKVFEGDIVEYGRSLYVCEFVEGGFAFRDISDDRLTLNAILIEAEVIGNVYDNPELLSTK